MLTVVVRLCALLLIVMICVLIGSVIIGHVLPSAGVLIYAERDPQAGNRPTLYLLDLNTQQRVVYARNAPRVIFSPDRSRALIIPDVAPSSDLLPLYVVPALLPQPGAALISLRYDNAVSIPAWSPDGSTLTYSRREDIATMTQLRLLDIATRRETTLTTLETFHNAPVFSGDGQRLLFQQWYTDQWDLAEFTLSDGSIERLTDTPYNEYDARYSPDDTAITFTSDVDANPDIFVMIRDTRQTMPLVNSRWQDSDGVLSPDGTQLAFTSLRDGGVLQMYVLTLASGSIRQLTQGSGAYLPAWWS